MIVPFIAFGVRGGKGYVRGCCRRPGSGWVPNPTVQTGRKPISRGVFWWEDSAGSRPRLPGRKHGPRFPRRHCRRRTRRSPRPTPASSTHTIPPTPHRRAQILSSSMLGAGPSFSQVSATIASVSRAGVLTSGGASPATRLFPPSPSSVVPFVGLASAQAITWRAFSPGENGGGQEAWSYHGICHIRSFLVKRPSCRAGMAACAGSPGSARSPQSFVGQHSRTAPAGRKR